MSASARRRSGRGSGKSSGAWKKSPLVAGLLIAAIVVVWVFIFLPGGDNDRYVIRNMDFVFIAQNAPGEFDPNKEPALITLQYDNNTPIHIPFQKDGQWLWEAYECQNEACPFFRAKQTKFVFPNFNEKQLERTKNPPPADPNGPPPDEMMEPPSCQLCKAANVDAYRVERYMTEKAKQQQKEMTEKILRENP